MQYYWNGATIAPPTRTDWPRYGNGWGGGGYVSDPSCGTSSPSGAFQDIANGSFATVIGGAISALKGGPTSANYCDKLKRILLMLAAAEIIVAIAYIVLQPASIWAPFLGTVLAAYTAWIAFKYLVNCTKF